MNPSAFYDPLTKTFKFSGSIVRDPMPNLYPSDLNARLDMFEERMKKLEEKIFPKEIKIDYFTEFFPTELPKILERELKRMRFEYNERREYYCDPKSTWRMCKHAEKYALDWDDYLENLYDSGYNPFSTCDTGVYTLFAEQQQLRKVNKLQIN